MSDCSSDEGSEEWIPYKDRPDWSDIQPIAQNDGPFPVVAIAYPDKYRDVYDYFRGVFVIGEKSERVLRLCTDASILNPANYTVWQYRRVVLKSLGCDLRDELQFIGDVIEQNPKNYQVWHHRRVIIEWLDDGSTELAFTKKLLDLDAKNYHAWQHRQWVLTKYKLFDGELDYIDELLTRDIRNNSAWNHRYFVINTGKQGFTPDVLSQEIKYVANAIQNATKNESAWNYLRGILLFHEQGLNHPDVIAFCEQLYKDDSRSPHLLAFLADRAVELVEKDIDREKNLQVAVKLYRDLAEEYDKMRAPYWNYLIEGLQKFNSHSKF
ncbi:protein farnesyltransferase/geranylgeranyltransferase type-1 subunit alpha [Planococcus citri]|uniref:protein farnesyltransferase/geranylgeranyltransferase type-1 subunit alpha n=1 Tax=Planococcus citri TaxID=170843 RepID=UPI0031F83190